MRILISYIVLFSYFLELNYYSQNEHLEIRGNNNNNGKLILLGTIVTNNTSTLLFSVILGSQPFSSTYGEVTII